MTKYSEADQTLIDAALAAAIDDALWADWLARAARIFNADGGFLGVLNRKSGEPVRGHFDSADERMFDEYISGMATLDPQVPFTRNVHGAKVYCIGDYPGASKYARPEFESWLVDRTGWVRRLALATQLSPYFASGVTFAFSSGSADYAEKHRLRLEALAPPINSALRLGFANGEKLTEEYWRGLKAERDATAVFLFGESGAVIRMNAKAESLVMNGAVLRCHLGRLACTQLVDQPAFEALIRRSIAAIGAVPGDMPLSSADGSVRYFVHATPLVRQRRSMVVDEPAAIMTLRERRKEAASEGQIWREVFGLTAAEARIAERLRLGSSAEAIAEELHIRIGTIRTHIKRIHDKTETRRNSELAHLLTKIGRDR